MKKNIIDRIYYLILAISFILFFTTNVIIRKENIVSIIISMIALAFCLIVIWVVEKRKIVIKWCHSYIGVCVFFLAFIPRILYVECVYLYTIQVSDFEVVLNHALTGEFTDKILYYRVYLHKMAYPILLNLMHITSQHAILILQSVILSVTAVLIYYIGKKIHSERCGIISAIIYSLWPSLVIYTNIITEEHVAAFVLCCLVLLMISLIEQLRHLNGLVPYWRTLLLLAVGNGVCFGAITLFKDWGPVVLCAFLICFIYIMVKNKVNYKQMLIAGLLCVIIIIGLRIWIHNMFVTTAAEKLGVIPSNEGPAIQMTVTLDPDSSGGYDTERYMNYYDLLEEYDYNYSAARNKAFHLLFNKIKNQPLKFVRLLLEKGKASYVDNGALFSWAFNSMKEGFYEQHFYVMRVLKIADGIYFCGIVILMMVTAVFAYRLSIDHYFLLLSILGGGLANLLVESQGRYKYSIESIWCVCAALGLVVLLDVLKKTGKTQLFRKA